MLSQYFITLISAFVSLYMPFNDVATRVACSMAISQIIVLVMEKFYNNAFYRFNIMRYFWVNNYIVIRHTDQCYEKLIEFIYKNNQSNLAGCQLSTGHGKYKMMIDELAKGRLYDTFKPESSSKTFNVKIELINSSSQANQSIIYNDSSEANSPKLKDLKISSNASINILEEYIQNLMKQYNNQMVNSLLIYKPHIYNKKNRYINWRQNNFSTNKTIKNTIVSDDVNRLFFEDVYHFLHNEKYYISKGLPYKRGYLLHGEPGCGKTSLIKAVANEYNIPIFIIDLSVFENNNELIKIVQDVNNMIASKQMHLLVFEDVDRSDVFKRREYAFEKKAITEDCILNILDGLDEGYGRITILTTNNLETIKSLQSLVRPGRVDSLIHVTLCTHKQINKIMELYYDHVFENEINNEIKIAPAKLIQLISIIKQEQKVITILNKFKDFQDFDVEKLVQKINSKKEKKDKIDDKSSKDEIDEEETIKEINLDECKGDEKNKLSKDDKRKLFHALKRAKYLKSKKTRLDKLKQTINTLEKNFDNNCEKSKLLIERHKINAKLMEIEYQRYEDFCRLQNKEQKVNEEKVNEELNKVTS